MALRYKKIDYTVYAPRYEPGKGCWDFRAATKARLAAKRSGVGSQLRRNVYISGKSLSESEWYVERIWEWDGTRFVTVDKDSIAPPG